MGIIISACIFTFLFFLWRPLKTNKKESKKRTRNYVLIEFKKNFFKKSNEIDIFLNMNKFFAYEYEGEDCYRKISNDGIFELYFKYFPDKNGFYIEAFCVDKASKEYKLEDTPDLESKETLVKLVSDVTTLILECKNDI